MMNVRNLIVLASIHSLCIASMNMARNDRTIFHQRPASISSSIVDSHKTRNPIIVNINTNIMLSFSTLQGAAILGAHAAFTKVLLSFTCCTASNNSKKHKLASLNMPLCSFRADHDTCSTGAYLAVIGQVVYVWMRTLIG
jgi:hypothetical protein